MLRVADDYFERTDTGRARRANEDAAFARPPLFAVADGMGGAQAGEVASRVAVEELEGGLPDGGVVEERLAGVVRQANARIHEMSRADERRAGMGTTITVAHVGEDEVSVAHVGDSRMYRLRDGRLERLTTDHSLVEEFVRQGRLTPEEASEHPQRSIITRALGPEPGVDVDTGTWPCRDGDVFLLCSDGLTSMVPDERIAEVLRDGADLQSAGHRLVDAANAAGGRDNITVVLFRLEEVGGPAAGDEQDTAVGDDALRSADVHAAVATAAATTAAPAPATRRLEPQPAHPRRESRSRRLPRRGVAALVALAIAALLAAAAVVAIGSVYFVGLDEQGFVTVYRGVPYELPLGIDLYRTEYVSGVHAEALAPSRREGLLDHQLRSHADARDLVRQLEQGRLAGARAP